MITVEKFVVEKIFSQEDIKSLRATFEEEWEQYLEDLYSEHILFPIDNTKQAIEGWLKDFFTEKTPAETEANIKYSVKNIKQIVYDYLKQSVI